MVGALVHLKVAVFESGHACSQVPFLHLQYGNVWGAKNSTCLLCVVKGSYTYTSPQEHLMAKQCVSSCKVNLVWFNYLEHHMWTKA